jgi:hypothetical protein
MLKRIALTWFFVPALVVIVAARVHAGSMAIPDNLTLPRQSVELFRTTASGVQVYVCSARADLPGTYDWVFKAPEADLWNAAGQKVGRHYAGPTWEGMDGSKVLGEVVERASAPEAGAIPWLLLRAKANEGAGAFSTVTYVQRLETVGGIAPADGCDQSTLGIEHAVEYQATYAFAYGAAE